MAAKPQIDLDTIAAQNAPIHYSVQVKHCTEYNVGFRAITLEVGYSKLADTISAQMPEGCTAAGRCSVTRRLRNHPHGDRLPDAIARLALIRDEVGVIAVLNFVPIGFDMSCH